MLDVQKTAAFLVEQRRKLGMTQVDVASRLNVSYQAVSKWENGTLPNVELLVELAQLFHVTVDEILAGRKKGAEPLSYSRAGVDVAYTDAIKKELAARLLNKLCNTKNIEPNKIKNYYCEIKNSFDIELVNLGKEIINKNFNISFSSDSIYHDVALMKYRMSYGQNLLEHSIECAKLAIIIAKKLDLDSNLALQCAFFHDIGKVLDNEKLDMNHVDLGVE